MLKVCFVIDCEGFVSFSQVNPMWNSLDKIKARVNNLFKNFRYDGKGFYRIHDVVVRNRFPVSLMLVGSIFKPVSKENFIDYGYHGYNHLPLNFISDSELEKEVKNINNAVSFSPPIGFSHDLRAPARIFKALKKEGYKIIPYRGTVRGNVVTSRKVGGIDTPVMNYGIKCVYVSAYLADNSENWKQVLKEIWLNRKKDAVYLLTTHDFSNKKIRNFELLVRKLKEMDEKKEIKLVTLKQLAK